MILITPNLLLRPLAAADAEEMFTLDRDLEVMRFLGPIALSSPLDYLDRIRDWNGANGLEATGWYLSLRLRSDLDWIGWLHLRPALEYRYAEVAGYRENEFDLGYRLRQQFWGRGYMTEAVSAVLRQARRSHKCQRIVASALIGNVASIRVMEKVGLVRERYFQLPGYDQVSVRYGTPSR